MTSPRQAAKSVQHRFRRARIAMLALPRAVPWVRRRLRLPANRPFDPLRDAGSAGMQLKLLEASDVFERPLPAFAPGCEGAAPFFAARRVEQTAAAYVAELEGGIGWGHPTGGVFTRDWRFVPDFTHDPSGPHFHAAWTRLSMPAPRRIHGSVLYLVTPEATDNYHHWLIDLLPRLGQLQRAGYEPARFDRVIVNHAGRRYQFATLERFGVRAEQIVTAHRGLVVQADRLVVPSLKPSNQTLPAADLAFLRQSFLGPAAEAAPAGRPLRLFLSRRDASYRRLRNESELDPLLRAQGFTVITPGELAVVEQARRFAEAGVIAGPAGAALANLVFARPGSHVIEIAPPQWLAAFHWMISARLGLRHTIVLGEGPVMQSVPDAAARRIDLVVRPERLAAVLEQPAVSHPA